MPFNQCDESVIEKKTGLSLNSTKQKRYLRYLTDIQKVSIGAELAWTTVTQERSDRVVLSQHYNGKISTVSWLSPQYDGETKGHRDMGTPSKNVPSAGSKAQISCNKRTIQPNTKAPRRTPTLTFLNKTNWKLSLNALVVVSVSFLDVPTGAFLVRKRG